VLSGRKDSSREVCRWQQGAQEGSRHIAAAYVSICGDAEQWMSDKVQAQALGEGCHAAALRLQNRC
jgi:hypothetical protein